MVLAGCGNPTKKAFDERRAGSIHRLGARLLEQGEPRSALPQLERAVDVAPKNALYRNSLGLCFFALGRWDLAEEQYKRALKLDAALTEAHSNLGVVFIQKGSYELAEAEFRRALADPGYLYPERVHINWGLMLEEQGLFRQAEERFREAIQANARYPRGHYELGRFLEKRGDRVGALREYLQAWGGMSEVPALNLKLAQLYMQRGEVARAQPYLEKVIAVAPASDEASQARAYLDRLSKGSS